VCSRRAPPNSICILKIMSFVPTEGIGIKRQARNPPSQLQTVMRRAARLLSSGQCSNAKRVTSFSGVDRSEPSSSLPAIANAGNRCVHSKICVCGVMADHTPPSIQCSCLKRCFSKPNSHLGGFSASFHALRQCLESFDDLLNMLIGSGRVLEVLR
jgi:hypothetical protein